MAAKRAAAAAVRKRVKRLRAKAGERAEAKARGIKRGDAAMSREQESEPVVAHAVNLRGRTRLKEQARVRWNALSLTRC